MAIAIPQTRMWLLAAVILSFVAVPASKAASLYSIAGVPVDVTSESAIQAREEAIRNGQEEGLRRLLRKLTAPEYFGALPNVDGVDVQRMVRSFGVENEKVSAGRYIAEVSVNYDGDAVQELLQGRGIPVVLEASAPLLAVPARMIAGRLVAFTPDDPWSAAWGYGYNRNTVLDIVLPLGDLLDVTKLPANASNDTIAGGLAALASRYGAEAAVLLVAEGDPETSERITIRQAGNFNWRYPMPAFDLAAGADNVWRDAVAGSLRRLEQRWKADRLVRIDQVETLYVVAPLAGIQNWAHINKTLGSMSEVRSVQLSSFTQSQAAMRISFVGGLAQLRRSLENRGLRLAEELGQWQLRSAGSAQAG